MTVLPPERIWFAAHFEIFIDGEDLDPVEVASIAREYALDPNGSEWLISTRGYEFRIDLAAESVIEEWSTPHYPPDWFGLSQ